MMRTALYAMHRNWLISSLVILLLAAMRGDARLTTASTGESQQLDRFTFAVAADMRYFTGPGLYDSLLFFRGAAQAIAASHGEIAFLVSPGDIDPPPAALWTITSTLGTHKAWYPVIGNHELPGQGSEPALGANLAWLNAFDYGAVNPGPASCRTTTYSFDYQNAHFAVLNEYCDASGDIALDGDISDAIYEWLENDLLSHNQKFTFIIGHEPAYPQPDADNGRLRHSGDSLDKYPARRDRFWDLLKNHHVTAYICGHTHNYSVVQINGMWQVDAGHARGLGDPGARSTFLIIEVSQHSVAYKTYRDDADGGAYTLRHSGLLASEYQNYLPVITR